jgi:dihydrofolate synthase/folylpolyglutamate synthase
LTNTLQGRLEALYGLERRKDKLGLEGTRALLAALGDPHRRFRSVHVAGTNGKGSVCAIVERVLREAGHRTGLFTSPHLVDFRERIRVRGQWADERWLEKTLERIASLPEGKDCTFFEACTALAFQYFAEQRVEIAVVEVGLGGRLDCTNVITPEVCVITSIGLDHTELLGTTMEEIAAEKAGIVKPGVPVVVGPMPDPARAVIERIAAERGAPIVPVAGPGPVKGPAADEPAPEGVAGINRAIAHAALATLVERGVTIPAGAVARGTAAARWPGRLGVSPREPRLWWDGAHNVDGMRHLVARWTLRDARTRPPVVVLALSNDKDAGAILAALREGFPDARLIATRSRSERARAPAELARLATEAGFTAEALPDVPTAVRRGLEVAGTGIVLLAGSLFAVGEAMEAWGGAPGEML